MNDSHHDDDEENRRLAAAVFRAQLAEAFRRRTPMTWVIVGFMVLIGASELWAQHWLGDQGLERLLLSGAVIPERVLQGEWWRTWTGPLLHKSTSHLLLNVVGLAMIGRQIELAYGASGLIMVWLGASLSGAMGTVLAGHPLSVGASGGVFGMVGAFLAIGLRLWPRLQSRLRISLVVLPAGLLLVMLGLGELADELTPSQLDRQAHGAGALCGLLVGLGLPLRLHDDDGLSLTAPAGRASINVVRVLAALGALVVVATLAFVGRQAQTPPTLDALGVTSAQTSLGPLRLPSVGRRGVWRESTCQGELVDADWALSSRRTLCVELPMGGLLLTGRRDRLLKMDIDDRRAMRQALAERRFVRRERGVLVHPIGDAHLHVVLAADVILPTLAEALSAMLPIEATVTDVQP